MAGGKVKFEEPEPEEGGTSTPPDQLGQIPGDGIVLRASPRRGVGRSPRRPLEAIDEEGSGVSRLGDGSGRAATQGSCISPPPRRRGGPSFNSPFAGLAAAVSFSGGPSTPGGLDWGQFGRGTPTRGARGAAAANAATRGHRSPPGQQPMPRVSHLPEVMTPTALDGGAALSPQRLLDFCLSPLNARSPEARGISHGAEGEMADLLPGGLGDGGDVAAAARAMREIGSPRRDGSASPGSDAGGARYEARGYRKPPRRPTAAERRRQSLDRARDAALAPPTPSAVAPPPASTPSCGPPPPPGSADSRGRAAGATLVSASARKRKGRDGSGGGFKPCNCKKSKCLKLYCECYAAGVFCRDCNCSNCLNKPEDGEARPPYPATHALGRLRHGDVAVPTAVLTSAQKRKPQSKQRQESGCFCKKSKCLKKYCECFEAGVHCEASCKCENCENYDGSAGLAAARAKLGARGSKSRRVSTGSDAGPAAPAAQVSLPFASPGAAAPSPERPADDARPARPADAAAAAVAAARAIVAARRADQATAGQAAAAATILVQAAAPPRFAAPLALAVAAAAAPAAPGAGGADAVASAARSEALRAGVAAVDAEHAAGWARYAAGHAVALRAAKHAGAFVDAALAAAATSACFNTAATAGFAPPPDLAAFAAHRDAALAAARATDAAVADLAAARRAAAAAAHSRFVDAADARDGAVLADALPVKLPNALQALECLPSEDLYGACLVSKRWSRLALDGSLWGFF